MPLLAGRSDEFVTSLLIPTLFVKTKASLLPGNKHLGCIVTFHKTALSKNRPKQ
jgi:hypothetical protein